MSRRVLYVRGADAPPPPRALCEGFDVQVAVGARSAFDLSVSRGPFAAVVADEAGGELDAGELLRVLRAVTPDAARVLRTRGHVAERWLRAFEARDVDALIEAADEGALVESVARGVEGAEAQRSERRLLDELRFVREATRHFTEVLEARLDERLRLLESLNATSAELHRAESPAEVARVAAGAVAQGLPGRGVCVRLHARAGLAGGEAHDGPWLGERRRVVPVRESEEEIGRIVVAVADGARTVRTEEHFLGTVASLVASRAAALARTAERDEAQHATILAFARLAEFRDDETGRHVERVSTYCRLLATALRDELGVAGIDDAFVENIGRSAPLHDIGKVGIADAILLKPGPLDEEEWRIMRGHTEIGARALAPIVEASPRGSYLRMGLEIAWCHHERWDGSGYPRGLAGEAIPLAARILALADVYDALTTRRPYKEPWSHGKARAEIEREAGSHFDPSVVEAFLAVEDEFDRVRRQLPDAG